MKRELSIITQGVDDTQSSRSKTSIIVIADADPANNFEIAIDCYKKSGNTIKKRLASQITIVFTSGKSWTGTIHDLEANLNGIAPKAIKPHRTSLNEIPTPVKYKFINPAFQEIVMDRIFSEKINSPLKYTIKPTAPINSDFLVTLFIKTADIEFYPLSYDNKFDAFSDIQTLIDITGVNITEA